MKTVLITGANRGIGLALTEYYLQQQYHVHAVCRQAGQLQQIKNKQLTVISGCDIRDPISHDKVLHACQGKTFDLIIAGGVTEA